MKILLIILSIIPFISNSQVIVDTTLFIKQSGDTVKVVTYRNAMNVGKLYIVIVGTSNDAGTVATVSLSGTGQTWDEISSAGGVVNGGNRKRIQAFRFSPSSTNTNTISITYTGTQDGGWVQLYEIGGVDVSGTNGVNAIVQSNVGSANSADPTLTLSALQLRASVLFAVINGTNPFGGTPESGWTESIDAGYATPNTGGYIMYRTNTSDNTPTVTMSSDNWAGFAIEFKASFRRIIITN